MNHIYIGRFGSPARQDQQGQSMMAWVLLMTVMFSGLMSALAGYTMTSVKSTQRSSDFVIASQLATQASQDAVYQFNQGLIASGTDPATAGTACGSSIADAVLRKGAWDTSKLGCGVYQSSPATGKWKWSVTDSSSGAAGNRYTVTAEGAYGGADRSISVNLMRAAVSAVTYDSAGHIGYTVAPSSAFQHALFAGGTDAGQGVSWVKGADTASDVSLQGTIGANNLVDVNPLASAVDTPSTSQNVTGTFFYNYGATSGWESRCNTAAAAGASSTYCQPVVRAPQSMTLNSSWVNSLANQCGGTPYKWVASEQAGTLFAGNGNSGCYTDMVFDRDTTIVGNSFYSAFVSGNVTINPGVSITAVGSAGLVIYTNGSVTATAGGSSPKELDLYVYGPKSTCSITDATASTTPLTVVGSLACEQVTLSGVSAKWKQAPDGVDNPGSFVATSPVYTQNVWYADSPTEGPSGALK